MEVLLPADLPSSIALSGCLAEVEAGTSCVRRFHAVSVVTQRLLSAMCVHVLVLFVGDVTALKSL